jgi:cyclic 2,3-diphosphoglycerate synthetase
VTGAGISAGTLDAVVRTLVLVDGEHYPPVVRAAIDHLSSRNPAVTVLAAVLLGGGEKLAEAVPDVGVPVVTGASAREALTAALEAHRPELVVDLSDEPVVDDRSRLGLAAIVLATGASYEGADFRLDAPPRPHLATKPAIAVIGTGKRTGKTAVSAHLARTLAAAGRPPVIVAMSRGGPAEPELVDPTSFDLSIDGLLALADSGRHAASDHLEDALVARVATVGTRRCGGGLAGAPYDSTFAAGLELANERPEGLLVLEGSGRAIPPVHADATVCVVPAHADPELVTGYLGSYRLLLSDAVVITMAEASLTGFDTQRRAGAVAEGSPTIEQLERGICGVVPGARIIRTVFRPTPLVPLTGRRVAFATTAPPSVSPVLKEHLEREHSCTIAGISHHLGNRPRLRADLDALDEVDVLLVELKAAAVDVAVRFAKERDIGVVLCDNRVVSVGGETTFEDVCTHVADLATDRYHP